MEAPEHIYIFDNPLIDFTKLSQRQSETDIEYIRKDVFVERAINWLRNELLNFEEPIDTEKTFLEDFKMYMGK